MDTIDRNDAFDVTSAEDLAAIYKAPMDTVIRKQSDHITPPGRAFIACSPFLILSTGTGAGIDCSPKGDAPGFVQVVDDKTLLIPDRPGNNRIDGMKNLIENPQVGIIFMVPGSDVTFRVNGTAKISTDPALLERCKANGKLPLTVMVVTVQETFPHCPKAFVRAKLWKAGTEGPLDGTPTHGDFAAHRDGGDEAYARQYDIDTAQKMPGQLY
jgi:PPOX class probable FMN-dependent enzyme